MGLPAPGESAACSRAATFARQITRKSQTVDAGQQRLCHRLLHPQRAVSLDRPLRIVPARPEVVQITSKEDSRLSISTSSSEIRLPLRGNLRDSLKLGPHLVSHRRLATSSQTSPLHTRAGPGCALRRSARTSRRRRFPRSASSRARRGSEQIAWRDASIARLARGEVRKRVRLRSRLPDLLTRCAQERPARRRRSASPDRAWPRPGRRTQRRDRGPLRSRGLRRSGRSAQGTPSGQEPGTSASAPCR